MLITDVATAMPWQVDAAAGAWTAWKLRNTSAGRAARQAMRSTITGTTVTVRPRRPDPDAVKTAAAALGQAVATPSEVRKNLGLKAARRRAAHTRPQLVRRRQARPSEVGIHLGRTTTRTASAPLGVDCYATHEDVVLVVAPPRSGKTMFEAMVAVDAPGAVLTTSSRPDLARRVMRHRPDRAHWVLNGEQPHLSSLAWSPVDGCEDPATAGERAADLMSGAVVGGSEDAVFWRDQGTDALRVLLHAAALVGADLRQVREWATDPDGIGHAASVLHAHPGAAPGWDDDALGLHQGPALPTIQQTARQALKFMQLPAFADLACPPAGAGLDLAAALAQGDSVHLVCRRASPASLTPLITALSGALVRIGRRLAADAPGERLDPPLTLALDEAPISSPIPLDEWTADCGGWGIPMVIVVQSVSQLIQRYGDHGARTIWNNATSKLALGGLSTPAELADLAALAGPGVTPDQVRRRERGRGLLIHRTTRPVEVVVPSIARRTEPPATPAGKGGPLVRRPSGEAVRRG